MRLKQERPPEGAGGRLKAGNRHRNEPTTDRPGSFEIRNRVIDVKRLGAHRLDPSPCRTLHAGHLPGLTHATKAVLCSLAHRANARGRCSPSCETIAADTSLSTRTVMRAISALEERGLLRSERQHNNRGRRTSNQYTLSDPPSDMAPARLEASDGAPISRGVSV